jgi:hypothetical protein
MRAWLAVALALLALVVLVPVASAAPVPTVTPAPPVTPSPPPVVTPVPATGRTYGPAINTDTLAEAAIGEAAAQSVAVRFRAEQSSALASIRIYDMGSTQPGYGAGTGGTIQLTVQTDNGAKPSGTVLATQNYTPTDAPGHLIPFSAPATLTAGMTYYVVFTNIDANPSANWTSIDNLYVYAQSYDPIQPKWPDNTFTLLNKRGTGSWAVYSHYTPIIDLAYANGQHQGNGYMEVNVNAPGWHATSGDAQIRETFTPKATIVVTGAHVRVRRVSGSDPLALTLETAAGAVLAAGTVPAASIAQSSPGGDNGGAVWAKITFRPLTLTAGQAYNLRVSTANTSTYATHGIRKGSDYGYSPQTWFNDGQAYWTTGSSWATWKNDDDIQFYLDVQ